MKRSKILILMLLLTVVIGLVGCKKSKPQSLKILTPNGTPAIAVGSLTKEYDITFVSGPDLLVSELVQDNYDIIIAPIIAGAKVHATGKSSYKLAAGLTKNNLYLVSQTTEIPNMSVVEGKRIAAWGRLQTPDIVLQLAIDKAKIEKLDILYQNSVADVMANHLSGAEATEFLMTSEPFKTQIELKNNIQFHTFDLAKDTEMKDVWQAGVFVKESNKAVTKFLNQLNANVKHLHDNLAEAVEQLLAVDQKITPLFNKLGKTVLEKSIPNSGIEYQPIEAIRFNLATFFEIVIAANPKLLGEQPSEDFYL